MLHPIRQLALLLALRALPFVVYAVLSRRSSPRRRMTFGFAYLVVLALNLALENAARLGWCWLGMTYYLACACGVPAAARALHDRALSRGALFVSAAAVYLVVPCLFTPAPAIALFLVIGWELLLSTYSYCCEVSSQSEPPSLGDCLFFLLVNPVVCYTNRGHRIEVAMRHKNARALRAAFGTLLMLVSFSASSLDRSLSQAGGTTLLAIAGLGAFRLFGLYAGHSALADIQIGLLEHAGYAVHERYRKPWLARSPSDFWRRWNTYVGEWLRRYVFSPVLRRVGTAGHVRAAHFIALWATLLASAALHDAFTYLSLQTASTRAFEFFAASGVATLVWAAAVRARRLLPWLEHQHLSAVSRLSLWSALISASVLWG